MQAWRIGRHVYIFEDAASFSYPVLLVNSSHWQTLIDSGLELFNSHILSHKFAELFADLPGDQFNSTLATQSGQTQKSNATSGFRRLELRKFE